MSRRAGFTLIEVVVAITVAALVIVAARQIYVGVADGTAAIRTAREALDRHANARRWLKSTFLSLEPPFEGRTDRVTFTSWQPTAGGWFEPEATALQQSAAQLIGTSPGQTLYLADGVSGVAFDYLLEPGADTKWVREWISPVSAPLAIRIRVAGCGKRDAGCVDTLLFLVKERG